MNTEPENEHLFPGVATREGPFLLHGETGQPPYVAPVPRNQGALFGRPDLNEMRKPGPARGKRERVRRNQSDQNMRG